MRSEADSHPPYPVFVPLKNAGLLETWINLLEERKTAGNTEKVTGSVKSVVLGEDNLLVLNDLNCEDCIFPLAWDAVLVGKRAKQDFRSLKPGDFVEVELDGGRVKRVTLLEVKKSRVP